ncbi:hypothetical protein OUZ56_007129 [Daphnia magna]|uniref:Uncharacterized protein n=1 Tax=Daphnia magna TaxID=35525 RepID=A0ABQ9YXN5_9CRUS|nr:hypothetical protein OUZ56_007129 [Daphnia magna]
MDACSSELKAGYNASCKLRKHSEQRSKEILVAIALMRFITCIRCRKILINSWDTRKLASICSCLIPVGNMIPRIWNTSFEFYEAASFSVLFYKELKDRLSGITTVDLAPNKKLKPLDPVLRFQYENNSTFVVLFDFQENVPFLQFDHCVSFQQL